MLGLKRRAAAETLELGGGRLVTHSGPQLFSALGPLGVNLIGSASVDVLSFGPKTGGQLDTAENISLWQQSTHIGAGLRLMETVYEPTQALGDQPCRWE